MSKDIKKIHFVGIKGVGQAPLAIIAKESGFVVSGCDIADEFITDASLKKAGITPIVGFNTEHIKGVDLVITTGAHGGYDNLEVKEAKALGIPVWTQGQAVGEFMKGTLFNRTDIEAVAVTGSHGKTTTTAMIATILKENAMDPSFLIGTGTVSSLGSSGHFGKGSVFVAEADEYATEPKYDHTPKFLWIHPKYIVFTNIELDHPDLYPTVEDIEKAFLQFAKNIPHSGALIGCGDDSRVRSLFTQYDGRVVSYGRSPQNDFQLTKTYISEGKTFFWVQTKGTDLGEFSLHVVGEHNALNALAATVVCVELGLSIEKIKKGLLSFTGSERRFEFVGTLSTGALLYDDYAHHPTEIATTLKAFRQNFPKKKLVCVFQPHTYSRTKALYEEFTRAFREADEVILMDIYASLREAKDETVSSRLLAQDISRFQHNVQFLSTAQNVVEYVNKKGYSEDTVIISMGAGDVYKIAPFLVK